jgi:hypothetical protein
MFANIHILRNVCVLTDYACVLQDFVSELEKKERSDKKAIKDKALKFLTDCLHKLSADKHEITRRSVWRDWRTQLLELLTHTPELRALTESDVQDAFSAHVKRLEDDFDAQLKTLKKDLDRYFESLVYGATTAHTQGHTQGHTQTHTQTRPVLAVDTTWAEASNLTAIKDHPIVLELLTHTSTGPADVYRNVMLKCKERLHADTRLVKDVLFKELRATVAPESTNEQIIGKLAEFAGVRADEEHTQTQVQDSNERSLEGQTKQLLLTRRVNAVHVVNELIAAAKARFEEQQARRRKDEERFIALLQRYYYRRYVGVCMYRGIMSWV